MTSVRRLVLDVLKPHDPSLVEFTDQLSRVDGVAGATCTLVELDREVQNVEVTLEVRTSTSVRSSRLSTVWVAPSTPSTWSRVATAP